MKIGSIARLRNLNYELELVQNEGCFIFYNEEYNIIVVARPLSDKETPSDVINGIYGEPYDRLIDRMNNDKNLIIWLDKAEGCMTRSVILPGCFYKGAWNIKDIYAYLLSD